MNKIKGRINYGKIFVTEMAGFATIAAVTMAQIF